MHPSIFHPPGAVVFHPGALRQIGQHARALVAARPLLVTSRGMPAREPARIVLASLADAGIACVGTVPVPAEPGPPELEVALAEARGREPDLLVGLGGGSVLDAAKLLGVLLRHPVPLESLYGSDRAPGAGLPVILAPTTAGSGSEVSAQATVTDRQAGTKRGIKDRRLVAACAVVDPEALRTCSPRVLAMCGMDALTHAIEAYTGRRATPLSDIFALRAASLLWEALPRAAPDPAGADAGDLESLALGAMLAGFAFSITGTAAVHAYGYPLSARYGIPHGIANAIMLPHVVRYNRPATLRVGLLEAGLGLSAGELEPAITLLIDAIGLPSSLSGVGINPTDHASIAAEVAIDHRHLNVNARSLVGDDVLEILVAAQQTDSG